MKKEEFPDLSEIASQFHFWKRRFLISEIPVDDNYNDIPGHLYHNVWSSHREFPYGT